MRGKHQVAARQWDSVAAMVVVTEYLCICMWNHAYVHWGNIDDDVNGEEERWAQC